MVDGLGLLVAYRGLRFTGGIAGVEPPEGGTDVEGRGPGGGGIQRKDSVPDFNLVRPLIAHTVKRRIVLASASV